MCVVTMNHIQATYLVDAVKPENIIIPAEDKC